MYHELDGSLYPGKYLPIVMEYPREEASSTKAGTHLCYNINEGRITEIEKSIIIGAKDQIGTTPAYSSLTLIEGGGRDPCLFALVNNIRSREQACWLMMVKSIIMLTIQPTINPDGH